MEQSNKKSEGLAVFEIWKLYKNIQVVLKNLPKIFQDYSLITIKNHSLIHISLQLILYGLAYNHSSKIFESSLYKIKQASRDSKVNNILSVINIIKDLWSLNHFIFLSENDLIRLNVSQKKIDFFKKYLLARDDALIVRRDGRANIQISNTTYVESVLRTHLENGDMITIDSYSRTKKTNNQYVVICKNQEKFFAKIIAISKTYKNIYYKRAIYTEDNPVIQSNSYNRVFKVCFAINIEKVGIGGVLEKCVCYEVPNQNFAYCIKIVH